MTLAGSREKGKRVSNFTSHPGNTRLVHRHPLPNPNIDKQHVRVIDLLKGLLSIFRREIKGKETATKLIKKGAIYDKLVTLCIIANNWGQQVNPSDPSASNKIDIVYLQKILKLSKFERRDKEIKKTPTKEGGTNQNIMISSGDEEPRPQVVSQTKALQIDQPTDYHLAV